MIILGLGLGACLSVLSVLLGRDRAPKAESYLAIMAGLLAIALIHIGLGEARLIPIWLTALAIGPAFVAAPILFHLYILALSGQPPRRTLLWLSPAWGYAIAMLGVSLFQPALVGRAQGLLTLQPGWALGLSALPIAITLIFPWMSLHQLACRRRHLADQIADLDRRDLDWARILLVMTVCVIGLSALVMTGFALMGWDAARHGFPIVLTLLSLQMLAIARYAAREQYDPEDWRPVKRSAVTAIALSRLEAALQMDDLVLKEDLRLADLAAVLSAAPDHVTYSLKEAGESFYSLVNRQRTARFCALALSPEAADRSVLDLAFEAGFQSKPTFNRVFRQIHGVAPSVWLAKHRNPAG